MDRAMASRNVVPIGNRVSPKYTWLQSYRLILSTGTMNARWIRTNRREGRLSAKSRIVTFAVTGGF
jgi:hypothetical protein